MGRRLGKSTLQRGEGLNRVTRGRVLVNRWAIDVARCDAATLRRLRRGTIAMIFQQFGLLPWRTVRENVGLGLELRGDSAAERRRIVDEKLQLVGLERWADRSATSCRAACSSASASPAPSPPTQTSC
jgi:glycine betaine/proline transport system ATP-binding protein